MIWGTGDGTELDPVLPDPGGFGTPLLAMGVVAVVVLVVVGLARLRTSREADEEPEPLLTRQERTQEAADKLRELTALRDAGVLSEAEYAERRAAIVKDI